MTWVMFWHKIQIEKSFKNESYVILKLNELRNLRVNVPKDTTQGWVCPKDFFQLNQITLQNLNKKCWKLTTKQWENNNDNNKSWCKLSIQSLSNLRITQVIATFMNETWSFAVL
jgi:hypothetical protein